MIVRKYLFLWVCCGWVASLWGDPSDSLVVQEFRASIQELTYQIRAQSADLRLMEERISALETKPDRSLKMTSLSKKEEDLIADLKLLKGHLEKAEAALAVCEKRLNQLDKQWEKEIGGLKSSLQSMVAVLKEEDQKYYTVKSGDSLGQIALEQKIPVKKLKELNHLESDIIFPGQKILIP